MTDAAVTTESLSCTSGRTDVSWLPYLAGQLAAGLAAWATCPIPPAHPLYLDDVLVLSAWHVTLSAFACVVATWAVSAFVPPGHARLTTMLWQSASIAIWVSPLAVLLMLRLL